jgi:D-tyrosyl-tRNA(Tyr) deacylase
MIGLLQRVSQAEVAVNGETIAKIGRGLLVFIGVEKDDTERQAERLLDRLLSYRVFPDTGGRMNLSLRDTGGGLLLVPQFTLPADTGRGTRPSLSPAAPPETGQRLYALLVDRARAVYGDVQSGRFGADMQVSLVNDGPVTFWLQVGGKSGAATKG